MFRFFLLFDDFCVQELFQINIDEANIGICAKSIYNQVQRFGSLACKGCVYKPE